MLHTFLAMMLLAAAGCVGCRGKGASPGAEASAGPPKAHPPTATSSPAASSLPADAVQVPYELHRGCVEDVDLSQPPDAQLDAVGRWCAGGMDRVNLTSAAEPGAHAVWRVELDKHACVLAAVVGGGGLIEDVRLRAAGGPTIAELGPRKLPAVLGPACVSDGGTYELEVRASTQVMVGMWRPVGASDEPGR